MCYDHFEFDKNDEQILKNRLQIVAQNMHAFSFEWPYVSFSGLKPHYLFLLNVFYPVLIHRCELEPAETHHFKVCATVITTTNDLFVLSRKDKKYY